MDPITGGLAIVGLGMQIFGGMGSAKEAQRQAELSRGVALDQQKLNDQRQVSMEVNARRQQMEVYRNTQRARALALNNATSQGAQFGSGLQGGYGQIAGQSGLNLLGISNAVEAGRNAFAINSDITALNSQISDSKSSQSTYQGISSLGSSISGAAGGVGRMSQGINFGNIFGGGGNYSGTAGASNTGGIY